MIEFLKQSDEKSLLSIDKEIIEDTDISISIDRNSEKPFYEIHSNNSVFYEKIKNYKLSDFLPLHIIYFPIDFSWINYEISMGFWLIAEENSIKNEDKTFEISVSFDANLENWEKHFSFTQYFNEFKKIIDKSNSLKIGLHDENGGLPYGFLVEQTKRVSGKSQISDVMDLFIEEITQIYSEVERKLSYINSDHLLQFNFVFPEAIKISCEQYLLYFAKFLEDVGINITSELKEEAGKVLFSLTPTDDVEALDKIREALAVYLKLPESPINEIEYSENFALMRLQQQVRNLQHSQQMAKTELLSTQYALRLAQQNIDNQDQLITRQTSHIENQNKIIEKITDLAIIINSAENKEELEEIYEGVKVGESKWLKELTGIGLNPAKAIKTAVKNTFGKDEKNSILGLNEED